jgi:hypothetical protein
MTMRITVTDADVINAASDTLRDIETGALTPAVSCSASLVVQPTRSGRCTPTPQGNSLRPAG